MSRLSAFLLMIPLLMVTAVPAVARAPNTAEELLTGMVTEEIQPGVFRVDHDGVRDLSSADYWGVFASQDGSIWLDGPDDLLRLGAVGTHDWQFEEHHLHDFEGASDGTVWAVVVNDDEQALRSFDGESWMTHRAVGLSEADVEASIGDVEVASDGVVWAAMTDGTLGRLDADGWTWQTIETPTPESAAAGSIAADELLPQQMPPLSIQDFGLIATESDVWAPYFGGVWHYVDGAWEHATYGGPDIGALPDEVFWGLGPTGMGTSSDVVLYRHDATGWQQWSLKEHDMLPGGWSVGPYAVAPDGSFWAGWNARLEEDRCQGVSHFDGLAWARYLPGMCIPWLGMSIAPDGSMWVHAWEGEDMQEPFAGPGQLYVITPEAAAGTE